jgi:hypothetical protein
MGILFSLTSPVVIARHLRFPFFLAHVTGEAATGAANKVREVYEAFKVAAQEWRESVVPGSNLSSNSEVSIGYKSFLCSISCRKCYC